MSNVKFQLSLNKHPKDCPDYSLVNALNVRVSDDFSCLQTEESIVRHPTINDYISDRSLNIIGVIPCNKELVLFVKESFSEIPTDSAGILRYNEKDDALVTIYSNLYYTGGKIIGTFTYNVNNELIIAFSEYSENGNIPLKTMNLGVWDGANNTSEEREFIDGKLALTPEVKIPKVSSFDYVTGTSYKGWYYYFIRYKINKTDYTQWFPIGVPIFITTLELKNIFKYGLNNGTRNGDTVSDKFILNGISDYFSSKDDVADEAALLNISDIDLNYDYFQIGFSCISKTYSKAFRTADIAITSIDYSYTTNISTCIEYSISDLISNTYNYYNVKNVINYKNRLYISNYKESSIPDISEEELSKIRLRVIPSQINQLNDIKYKDLSSNSEYDTEDALEDDFIPANPTMYKDLEDNVQVQIQLQYGNVSRIVNGEQGTYYYFGLDNFYIITNAGVKIYGTPQYTNVHGEYVDAIITFTINSFKYSISCTWTTVYIGGSSFRITDASAFNNELPINMLFPYINTNNSFNDRKVNSTLIPGEIYNFYIHFVNKYGETTAGYRIPNTVKFRLEGDNTEYFPIYTGNDEYLLVRRDARIFDDRGALITEYIILVRGQNNWNYNINTNIYTLTGTISQDITDILNAIHRLNIYPDINGENNNLKWYELFSTKLGFGVGNQNIPFSYYINNKGDTLFKVPDDNFNYNEVTKAIEFRYWHFTFDLRDFIIPEGYVGYYFSYEKFEPQNKIDGILTKYDTFEQESLGTDYKKYNEEAIENIKEPSFYSAKLDTTDNLDLDCNILRIQPINKLYNSDVNSSYTIDSLSLLSKQYPINYNNVELPYYTTFEPYDIANINKYAYIPVKNVKLRRAGNISDGRFGVGSSLSIDLTEDQRAYIFNNRDFVRASLIKISRNIYTNENKVLIKFTDIFYVSIDGRIQTIDKGLNGHITYQGTLVYNFNKFIMSAENVILTEQYKAYYRCPVYKGLYDKRLTENRPPVAYIQQVCFSDIFYEAKCFKNQPETLFQNLEIVKADAEQIMSFAANNIVTPANSIDLFQELQTNQDKLNPKTYLSINNNRSYITQFDKRVQRSNVIADESLNNSWRTFPLEGYKDISENKGKITNLIGIGTTLLVHTEHSLFSFDGSSSLKTGDDKDIKLILPDIFDIDYTEVFTSDMGVCGLQDKEAWVVGQFGYIFYDNDAHRFYKFASKKIEVIDFDIVQFLNINIPYEVRFGHDIERNRLLIALKVLDKYDINDNPDIIDYTLSYNYQLNKFISLHSYYFSKGFNTKNTLYLLSDNKLYCNLHDLNRLDSEESLSAHLHKLQRRRYTEDDRFYGYFENGDSVPSSISIIVNTSYELIKTIEFLTYKLFKRISDTSDEESVSTPYNEREPRKTPYSGYILRIHNDMCDSGNINVSVDEESAKNVFNNYKKPWWEFGNWNFNYFRDTKYSKTVHDIMSRIYGNYFIIDFILYDNYNNSPQKIEFETLDVKLINDETV